MHACSTPPLRRPRRAQPLLSPPPPSLPCVLAPQGDVNAWRAAAAIVNGESELHKLFQELAPRYSSREGGYTRVVRTGIREGDAAQMAFIEYIDRWVRVGGCSRCVPACVCVRLHAGVQIASLPAWIAWRRRVCRRARCVLPSSPPANSPCRQGGRAAAGAAGAAHASPARGTGSGGCGTAAAAAGAAAMSAALPPPCLACLCSLPPLAPSLAPCPHACPGIYVTTAALLARCTANILELRPWRPHALL